MTASVKLEKLLVVSLMGSVAKTNWLAVNRQSLINCDCDCDCVLLSLPNGST
jgi:hypothetical protein